MARSLAARRYNHRVVWLSLAYVAALFAAIYAFNNRLIDGPAAYLAALLPALPIIGIFAAIGRYLLEEQDEYVRMLMVRQTLWASGFALSFSRTAPNSSCASGVIAVCPITRSSRYWRPPRVRDSGMSASRSLNRWSVRDENSFELFARVRASRR